MTIGYRRGVERRLEKLGLGRLAKQVDNLSFDGVTNLAWLLEQNRLQSELLKKHVPSLQGAK